MPKWLISIGYLNLNLSVLDWRCTMEMVSAYSTHFWINNYDHLNRTMLDGIVIFFSLQDDFPPCISNFKSLFQTLIFLSCSILLYYRSDQLWKPQESCVSESIIGALLIYKAFDQNGLDSLKKPAIRLRRKCYMKEVCY